MYSLFENIFKSVNDMGVEGFTNIFLVFQILLFLALGMFQLIRISKEMKVMDKLKKDLDQINRASNIKAHEVDKQINDYLRISRVHAISSFGHVIIVECQKKMRMKELE